MLGGKKENYENQTPAGKGSVQQVMLFQPPWAPRGNTQEERGKCELGVLLWAKHEPGLVPPGQAASGGTARQSAENVLTE